MSVEKYLPEPSTLPPAPNMRQRLKLGVYAVLFGFLSVVVWLVFAPISGAVIGVGQVVVESEVKKIQHQQGGIVGTIAVKNGDKVKPGDLLVRLDDTIAKSNLGVILSQLAQLQGRKARLEAERDERERLVLPPEFFTYGEQAVEIANGEQRLLSENRMAIKGQLDQLGERVQQLEKEIEGVLSQAEARKREIKFIEAELEGVSDLWNKQLVSIQRYNGLRREGARLEGEVGSLQSSIAKSRGQIAEIAIQRFAIPQKARAEAVKELRDAESQIAQLLERRIAAVDTLQRMEIRAPYAGLVHQSAVHSIGGVIQPGEPLMLIVPDNDRLTVEARISPADIDQIQFGQKVTVRFSAFNQRTTPEVFGQVQRIGADVVKEQQTGMTYFTLKVSVPESELARLKGLMLLPGMPAEVFIETGQRSALTYFVKPLTDSFARVFREE